MGASPAERRMALRLAAQRTALTLPVPPVSTLPSVRATLSSGAADDEAEQLLHPHLVVDLGDPGPPAPQPPAFAATAGDESEARGGDDDEDADELLDLDGDFYADAVEPLL